MPAHPKRARVRWGAGVSLAGSGLAGALAGAALVLLLHGPQETTTDPLLASVIDSHVRSLMAGHLMDVPTSDQHTVKPWLSQHVDVSPPVKQLAAEGFPLVGGRIDYVDGHAAAVVVYRYGKHVINLFAWASSDANEPMRTEARQGFNMVLWRQAGIAYAAVSDVEEQQLLVFARDIAKGS
jgi:anti-sigma factor RsiW